MLGWSPFCCESPSSLSFFFLSFTLYLQSLISRGRLSWADTTASTLGRLWGRYTPPLPSHVPGIRFLPFAPRKSLAGFLAAAVTGALITIWFWGGSGAAEKTVGYGGGEWKVLTEGVWSSKGLGIMLTAGVVGVGGAVVEALGMFFFFLVLVYIFSRFPADFWLMFLSLQISD